MDEITLIDQEFDNTEEHDNYIIEKFKEVSNNDIRNSTNVYGS